MKNKKGIIGKAGIITSVILTGSIATLSAADLHNDAALEYQVLGSGAELRTELLSVNKSTMDVSEAIYSINTVKFAEQKCGEGKCGEGESSGKKEAVKSVSEQSAQADSTASTSESKDVTKSDVKSVTKEKEARSDKTSESKCGEGKCG